MARFRDRTSAGAELGQLVAERGVSGPAVVLALPRGGVPVAVPVADALDAPLDVLVVRKLRTPGQPELAFGAVAGGGVSWLQPDPPTLGAAIVEAAIAAELAEVAERELRYRDQLAPLAITGRTVVLVDDGIATGSTVHAAVEAARLLGARTVVVAVPIAPPGAVRALEQVADRVDAVEVRSRFGAVSVLYDDFAQVPDERVAELLRERR